MFSRSLEISVTVVAIATSAMSAGCGRPSESQAPPQSASIEQPAQSSGSSATTAQASSATPTQLTRALIEQTVSEGLGAFLSRVEVTPVVNGRRFVGFRLESAEDLASWRAAGADLRVGDVVQQINGQTIERPEQALWAFEQLRIARGIEVVGVRGSAPFRVYSPIVDSQ